MGVNFCWLDETIVVITLNAPWVWDEYMQVGVHLLDEIRQRRHPVATVIDVRASPTLPEGSMLHHVRQIANVMPENVDTSVIVGASYLINSFMVVFIKSNLRAQQIAAFATTLDEAVDLIHQRRTNRNIAP